MRAHLSGGARRSSLGKRRSREQLGRAGEGERALHAAMGPCLLACFGIAAARITFRMDVHAMGSMYGCLVCAAHAKRCSRVGAAATTATP
jgi:hypothetical protein